ncbi:hypothetical protein HYS79_02215 [Patescibacteria group bacterium]|nr:hypothetical protein [Patescibacteria group bacterium]
MSNILTDIKTEQIGADLSKVVDRVSKQYDRPDIAFQKEAIQNSWDVRSDKKEGKEWLFKIYEYKDGNQKTHVVVEDFGTKGMNKERWEAFSSLWRPKKDRDDAGGKGQGKFVLMNASQEHVLFVESVSDDAGYICKFLQDGKKSRDEENFQIFKHIPSVKPLEHKGSRIWVYDVRDDFLKTLHSEEFADSIIECWWQVLGPRFNGKISLFDKEVVYKPLPSPTEEITLFENHQVDGFGRIKRLCLSFYADKVPSAFDGVMVQRANMMIVKIPFEVHDKEYQGRFSGYIEFDETLEKELKEIERNDHCSFQYESPWKEIKVLIKDEVSKFITKIVPSKEQRKTINIKNLAEVIQKANQIIDEYCPEILGGGTVVPPITPRPKPPIRIKHLAVNKREVKWGDTIKATCGILNTTSEDKKVSLNIEIKRLGAKVLEEEYSLKIKTSESKPLKLTEIKLAQNKFDKGKYIVRAILREQRHDLDTKTTSFYLESKREPVKKGFIKEIRFYESDEPLRNKQVKSGTLEINLGHKDFANIWSVFEEKPNIQTKQIGFFIMKLCLDEAVRELFKLKLKDESSKDIDDIVQEVKEIQDRMYYDVHA